MVAKTRPGGPLLAMSNYFITYLSTLKHNIVPTTIETDITVETDRHSMLISSCGTKLYSNFNARYLASP